MIIATQNIFIFYVFKGLRPFSGTYYEGGEFQKVETIEWVVDFVRLLEKETCK